MTGRPKNGPAGVLSVAGAIFAGRPPVQPVAPQLITDPVINPTGDAAKDTRRKGRFCTRR